MPGILADQNVGRHVELLLRLLGDESRRELWEALHFTTLTFAALDLPVESSDLSVWLRCQAEQLILITANRNEKTSDSLASAIRTYNSVESLPVITLANAERLLTERSYAERAADRLLEYLYDLDSYRGTGRLYIP